ncbi:aminoacyl-tRNA deacylase [Pseudotabrizicola algicola]|uniref:Cys-tRNA(Pro)/Cys-tRNA(Cys) deacylase n=1 Tax=Pseudotabrizicola algicola TaxID=2709381 RepID=A0A6B3RT39_9RHOB|nr:aminoacyl-tRNA deacylase [Pseudotabrizicola algicola]NEX46239.1 aminoacyl-tRNA deacylase [Pseudotabrizicola algicola]
MTSTPGLRQLAQAGVAVTLHPYDYDPAADAVGLAAARALGLDPGLTLKTLMVEVDGTPACCVIPSDRQLSMKRVASAFGGKSASMMLPAKAERLTGYRVGGISPFGQKKPVPTAIEASVCAVGRVWINAGARGLLLGTDPQEALRVLAARPADLLA